MRSLLALLVLVLFACGHARPKAPPPKELPVRAAEDVQGRWVAMGEVDWSYSLTIGADGTYDLVLDRGKLGRCETKGTLSATGDRAFDLAFGRNECDPNAANTKAVVKVTSFTGDALTITVGDQPRTYSRAPSDQAQ